MRIDTAFNIGQIVHLVDNDGLAVRVIKIELSGKNLFYTVQWWANGEIHSAVLVEDELSATPVGAKVVVLTPPQNG